MELASVQAFEILQKVVSSCPSMWTYRTYLAMAMALNCLIPSDTALATAFLSAQIPKFEHAFSTLQPVEVLETGCLTGSLTGSDHYKSLN